MLTHVVELVLTHNNDVKAVVFPSSHKWYSFI